MQVKTQEEHWSGQEFPSFRRVQAPGVTPTFVTVVTDQDQDHVPPTFPGPATPRSN